MAKLDILNKGNQHDLFELLQNEVLGAIAMHSFTLGFHNIARNKHMSSKFPELRIMFFVLPIVYNMSTMLSFLNSTELYTAIMKEHSIILGLQERANKMAQQTFNALNLAFSKNILDFNNEDNTVVLLKPFTSKKLPLPVSSLITFDNVKKIQDSSYRLGSIFAKKHEKNIQNDLNIQF